MKKHIFYQSFSDDIVTNQGQNYTIPDNYKWITSNVIGKICSGFVYCMAAVFSEIYGRFFLHIKVIGRENLKKRNKKGFYVYGNHTQMIGDAFIPIIVFRGVRMRAVVSAANLGIPVLGRILPYMGALPIPKMDRLKEFIKAVKYYSENGNGIVIYPEAHVWPFYTGIRPFGTAAFSYPASNKLPVYCMTTTYHKRVIGKKPKIIIYVDGPFYADDASNTSERKKELHRKIMNCMKERSRNSTYEYWNYEEKV